jgi:hypothetical protein
VSEAGWQELVALLDEAGIAAEAGVWTAGAATGNAELVRLALVEWTAAPSG